MLTTIKSLGLAAVLGATTAEFNCDATHSKAGESFSLYRTAVRKDAYHASLVTQSPALMQRILALPGLAKTRCRQQGTYLDITAISYVTAVEIAALMYQEGARFQQALANEQAAVAATGYVPPDYQAAYARFLGYADNFLLKVRSEGFPELVKSKGVRRVEAPRRSQALTFAAKGVYVYPDAFRDEGICVDTYSLSRNTELAVEDLAHEYFGNAGLRLFVTHR